MDDPPSAVHVLYVDHAGHPAPLSECYHATASRRLASSVHRWPASTTFAELESAYCPHCLTSHDGPTASRSPHCSHPTCQLCPVCLSATGIVTGQNRLSSSSPTHNEEEQRHLYYKCGTCEWTSLECDLSVPLGHSSSSAEDDQGGADRPSSSSSSGLDRLQLARAAEDLLQKLTEARGSFLRGVERHYSDISKHWEGVRHASLASGDGRGGGSGRGAGTSSWTHRERTSRILPTDPVEGWSVAALEAKLRAMKVTTVSAQQFSDGSQESVKEHNALWDGPVLALDELGIDESMRHLSTTAFQLQALHNGLGTRPTSFLGDSSHAQQDIQMVRRKDLLPLPIQLRPRKSRRCRAEIRDGRAGILLRPRLNPLEGDSSLRSSHGQWWKKDSSAIHVIPIVTVVKSVKTTWEEESGADGLTSDPAGGVGESVAPRRRRRIAVLLKVTNPTLGSLRFRFAASPYLGEPDWDCEKVDDGATIDSDPNQFTDAMPGLLVHTFTQTFWHVEYDSGVLRGLPISETVELHSAEDSIIELGGHKATQTPPEVVNWGESGAMATSSHGAEPALQFVAQRGSSAWYELTFVEPARFCDPESAADRDRIRSSTDRDSMAWAVAVRLEVEVGPGSWETSLIPPRSTASNDPTAVDRVPFDLLLAYQ